MDFFSHTVLKKTEVYNTYWRFANERQNIFIKKVQGCSQPWTYDEILSKYKFTNAYRANDRTSQYLIKNVIYSSHKNEEDILFRILLFKIFNKIDTWEYIESSIGQICLKSFSKEKYAKVLSEIYKSNSKIYSNAYIMPSGVKEFGHSRKYENHLELLDFILKNNFCLNVQKCKSLQDLYYALLKYPTIGPFLAYQYSIDINYSNICNFDEMEFVVAGPGAKSGIRKCFLDTSCFSESDIIKYMCYNQEKEFERLNLNFQNLWGRKLQLIDCQNLFCETDKYARVAHPTIIGISNRTRIKQIYRPNKKNIELFYPPKWNISIPD